jgi:hypothetical protein
MKIISAQYDQPDDSSVQVVYDTGMQGAMPANHWRFVEYLENGGVVDNYQLPLKTVEDLKTHINSLLINTLGSIETQQNMLTLANKLSRLEVNGTISNKDKEKLNLIDAAQEWKEKVLDVGRNLRKNNEVDQTFESKKHWPRPPKGLKVLIKSL